VFELERLGLKRDVVIIAVCTCPEDSTSERVVREFRRAGWPNARALRDGWNSWKLALLPVVRKG
jgi:rhodanese-related sulfurtransferase